MSDLFSIAATVALFALSIFYIHGCEGLTRTRKPSSHA